MGITRQLFIALLRLFTIAALLSLVAINSTSAADNYSIQAQSRITEFTAVDTPCELVNEGTITDDDAAGFRYIEGTIYRNMVTSDNPIFNGTSYIVVDTEINLETEETKLWVTGTFYPNLVEGTVIAPGSGVATEQGPRVSHSGHGTRELAGMRFRFEVSEAPESDDEPPCEPLFPPVQLKGVIIELP